MHWQRGGPVWFGVSTVGVGATDACVAASGLRVALVEKDDFGSGTWLGKDTPFLRSDTCARCGRYFFEIGETRT